MSIVEPKMAYRLTRAQGYVPGPSNRRARRWPVRSFGLLRTLTGVTFETAEKRLVGYHTLISRLTPEQWAAVQQMDDPWAPDSDVRNDPRAA